MTIVSSNHLHFAQCSILVDRPFFFHDIIRILFTGSSSSTTPLLLFTKRRRVGIGSTRTRNVGSPSTLDSIRRQLQPLTPQSHECFVHFRHDMGWIFFTLNTKIPTTIPTSVLMLSNHADVARNGRRHLNDRRRRDASSQMLRRSLLTGLHERTCGLFGQSRLMTTRGIIIGRRRQEWRRTCARRRLSRCWTTAGGGIVISTARSVSMMTSTRSRTARRTRRKGGRCRTGSFLNGSCHFHDSQSRVLVIQNEFVGTTQVSQEFGTIVFTRIFESSGLFD
mmetsp:Transcript_22324/g.40544  ORF Transcript_22324/g.40544 Transcript_22324/m.40544 type:complete len:279 (-) Transcript_22324:451-1287(-)